MVSTPPCEGESQGSSPEATPIDRKLKWRKHWTFNPAKVSSTLTRSTRFLRLVNLRHRRMVRLVVIGALSVRYTQMVVHYTEILDV